MREGGGAGVQVWKGGGRHQRQRECAAAATTDELLRKRDSQHTAAREARKHAGGMWMGAGQKRARKVQRGGKRELGCQRMGEWAVKVCSGR